MSQPTPEMTEWQGREVREGEGQEGRAQDDMSQALGMSQHQHWQDLKGFQVTMPLPLHFTLIIIDFYVLHICILMNKNIS
jgi:hypothetical protein